MGMPQYSRYPDTPDSSLPGLVEPCRQLLHQPVDEYAQAMGHVAVLRIDHVEG